MEELQLGPNGLVEYSLVYTATAFPALLLHPFSVHSTHVHMSQDL